MASEHIITFTSGSYQLVGTLHLPEQAPAPVVIGCHGLIANRQSPKQIALAQALNADGIAYFRFDHQGCGDSQGEFAIGADLGRRCRDLKSAADRMAHHPSIDRLMGLFGSSFGGTVVLSFSQRAPGLRLVTYAAPIISTGLGVSHIAEQLTPEQRTGLNQSWHFDIRPGLPGQHNIFVVHARGDAIVPPSHGLEIYNQARHPKQLELQNGGDHPMSDPDLQQRFLEQSTAWFRGALKAES